MATARTPATVEPLLADTYTTIPAIVMTGAALWDRTQHQFIDPIHLQPQAVPGIISAFQGSGINPFVYTLADNKKSLQVYHTSALTPHEQTFVDQRTGLPLKKFILSPGEIPGSALSRIIMLVFAMGPRQQIAQVAHKARRDPGIMVSVYPDIFNPGIDYIEIFHATVSKAAAVRRLADSLGAKAITVYGDNVNDLSMLAVASDAVAVANALPQVKQRASRCIGSNQADSVALDIQTLFHRQCD